MLIATQSLWDTENVTLRATSTRLLDRIFKRAKSVEPNTTEMTFETAIRIIEDYGAVLESVTHAPGCVVDARNLPHPKQRIKEALMVALRSTTDPHKREHWKTGLIYLAH